MVAQGTRIVRGVILRRISLSRESLPIPIPTWNIKAYNTTSDKLPPNHQLGNQPNRPTTQPATKEPTIRILPFIIATFEA